MKIQGEEHVLLKQDDVLGIMPKKSDYKSMKPLGDRVLIEVSLQCLRTHLLMLYAKFFVEIENNE